MKTVAEIKAITDIPAVTTNTEGDIDFVNQAFLERFNWDEDKILGQNITVIIPDDYHDAHNMGFSRFLTTNEPKILGQDLPLAAKDSKGDLHDVTVHIVAEKNGDAWAFAATLG